MVGSCMFESVGLRKNCVDFIFLPSFTGLTARSAGAATKNIKQRASRRLAQLFFFCYFFSFIPDK